MPKYRPITLRYPHLTLKGKPSPPLEGRPKTRADCVGAERPCPWVGCRHHLYLDVNHETGSIKLNFPELEPDQMEVSCSLDVADEGIIRTLEDIGELMHITRERIRQLESRALRILKHMYPTHDDIGSPPKRRPR